LWENIRHFSRHLSSKDKNSNQKTPNELNEIKNTKATNIAHQKPKFSHYSVASNKAVMWDQTNTALTTDEMVRPLVQIATHNSISRLGCSETPAEVINGLRVDQPSAVLHLSKSFTFR
jgi:hypothetical protein